MAFSESLNSVNQDKSVSTMVTRDTSYLTIYCFDVVVKGKFPLLSLVCYLFNVVSGNRSLSRASNGNSLSITTPGNVFHFVIR